MEEFWRVEMPRAAKALESMNPDYDEHIMNLEMKGIL